MPDDQGGPDLKPKESILMQHYFQLQAVCKWGLHFQMLRKLEPGLFFEGVGVLLFKI